MFVVPRPRMLVERVQFALVEQLVVGRLMTAEVEQEQLAGSGRSGMLAYAVYRKIQGEMFVAFHFYFTKLYFSLVLYVRNTTNVANLSVIFSFSV